jgi:hypothetical protein
VGIAPAYARLDDTRIGRSGQCWFWLVHLGLIADEGDLVRIMPIFLHIRFT